MSVLAQEWSEKVSAWRSSGVSVAAWCRQNAEGYHRFLYWRKRLGGQQAEPSGRFVELSLGPSTLHLECNGVTIRVDRDVDTGLLTDVLLLLKRM
jgi:hypothetical protein